MSRAAVIQMVSTAHLSENLKSAAKLIKGCKSQNADLIVLPENFAFMGFNEQERLQIAEDYGRGAIQSFLSEQAKEHSCWLIGGTIALKSQDVTKVRSASLLYNPQGQVAARYDKIHLFDVDVADNKKTYRESLSTERGKDVVIADTPLGKIGISVCYDIRFPELYRKQMQNQAQVFAISAAFTKVTGIAHWEILCRARAIENLTYVLAAAQGGTHENGRQTYGHSMIVDPWGKILGLLEEGEGFLTAEINLEYQQQIRRAFPSLSHRVFH